MVLVSGAKRLESTVVAEDHGANAFGDSGLPSVVLAHALVVFVLRRACESAFIRPGCEMLWSQLNKETKYKVKNTVDVPIYRGADADARREAA